MGNKLALIKISTILSAAYENEVQAYECGIMLANINFMFMMDSEELLRLAELSREIIKERYRD